MSNRKSLQSKFQFTKMWAWRSFIFQVRMELSYANWYQIINEYIDAFGAFSILLMKIRFDPKKRLPLDKDEVKEYQDAFWGDPESNDPMKIGLYALQPVQREFDEETHGVYLRGVGRTKIPNPRDPNKQIWSTSVIKPDHHHKMIIRYYRKMFPLYYSLWHQIIGGLDSLSEDMPESWRQAIQELKEFESGTTTQRLDDEEHGGITISDEARLDVEAYDQGMGKDEYRAWKKQQEELSIDAEAR